MVFSRGQVGYVVPGVQWPRKRTVTLRDDRSGVYRFDPRMEDFQFLKRTSPYSFWGAVKYIFLLSLMLWWIPLFGPMIAGYVGGRKAGNAWKAAIAAVLPVLVIWILALIVVGSGAFPELTNLFTLPALVLYGFGDVLPALDPYMHALVDYWSTFVIALQETPLRGVNGYLLTIIFAFVGGLVAAQMAKERRFEQREEAPPVPYPMAPAVGPMSQAVGPMPQVRLMPAAGPPWYGVHAEQYDHLRRIPLVSPYEREAEDYYEDYRPLRRPPLANRRPPEERYETEPEPAPRREPPSRRRARRLRQEDLIRRLVERALRDYDQAVR